MNQVFVAYFRGKWSSSFNRKTSYLSLKSTYNYNYTLILKMFNLIFFYCEFNPEMCFKRQKGKENPYNIMVGNFFLSERNIISYNVLTAVAEIRNDSLEIWINSNRIHIRLGKFYVKYPAPLSHAKSFLSSTWRNTCRWKYSPYRNILGFVAFFSSQNCFFTAIILSFFLQINF